MFYCAHHTGAVLREASAKIRGGRTAASFQDVSFELSNGDRLAIFSEEQEIAAFFLKAIAGIYPLNHGRISTNGRVLSIFNLWPASEGNSSIEHNIKYMLALYGKSHIETHSCGSLLKEMGIGRVSRDLFKVLSEEQKISLGYKVLCLIDSYDVLVLGRLPVRKGCEYYGMDFGLKPLIDRASIVVFHEKNLDESGLSNKVLAL